MSFTYFYLLQATGGPQKSHMGKAPLSEHQEVLGSHIPLERCRLNKHIFGAGLHHDVTVMWQALFPLFNSFVPQSHAGRIHVDRRTSVLLRTLPQQAWHVLSL